MGPAGLGAGEIAANELIYLFAVMLSLPQRPKPDPQCSSNNACMRNQATIEERALGEPVGRSSTGMLPQTQGEIEADLSLDFVVVCGQFLFISGRQIGCARPRVILSNQQPLPLVRWSTRRDSHDVLGGNPPGFLMVAGLGAITNRSGRLVARALESGDALEIDLADVEPGAIEVLIRHVIHITAIVLPSCFYAS